MYGLLPLRNRLWPSSEWGLVWKSLVDICVRATCLQSNLTRWCLIPELVFSPKDYITCANKPGSHRAVYQSPIPDSALPSGQTNNIPCLSARAIRNKSSTSSWFSELDCCSLWYKSGISVCWASSREDWPYVIWVTKPLTPPSWPQNLVTHWINKG